MDAHSKTRKIFGPVAIVVLSLAFLGIFSAVFGAPDKKGTKVVYFDVGQGDSAYLEFPDGKNALIDGGPDKKVLEGLGKEMPFYRHKIDVVFVSHPHADHIAGLIYVLKRYQVDNIVMTGAVYDTPEYKELVSLIKEKGVKVTSGLRGTSFDFSNGNKIKVLYPISVAGEKNPNNTSEVLSLESGDERFLFTGDLEKENMEKMLRLEPDLKTDVIKVPHHGSENALDENLYTKTRPEFAVISAGVGNQYGHPHKETLDFFGELNLKYFRTDKDGDIKFLSDGHSLRPER